MKLDGGAVRPLSRLRERVGVGALSAFGLAERAPTRLGLLGPLPRKRESDYLRCQVALAYWARASRAFALRRTSSLWARAIRTTIFSFPAASNLSRNSARVLSYLAAIAATRNRIERTLARPPRMDRLPWRLPLSSASGARPTSLAMALLE